MAEETKKTFKRGCGRDVAAYFREHPNKVIDINRLEQAFEGVWDRRQMLHALAPSTKEKTHNETLKRIETLEFGVWRLVADQPKVDRHGEPDQANGNVKVFSFEQMTVTIVKEVDGEMVVVDEFTNVYRMVKVG